jgi:hypothetical protein
MVPGPANQTRLNRLQKSVKETLGGAVEVALKVVDRIDITPAGSIRSCARRIVEDARLQRNFCRPT